MTNNIKSSGGNLITEINKEQEKKENELKLDIINNILRLKEKIDTYKQLSSEGKNIDKTKLLGELNIIKKYFQDIIYTSKQYLKSVLGVNNDDELNKLNGFIDKEKDLISAINNVDNEILSISVLIELFKLKGFQNFGDIRTFLGDGTENSLIMDTQKMTQFDATDVNNNGLINTLSNFGKATYKENIGVSQGPILVIYPEIHYSGPILKNNYEAIIKSEEYYNFLATEGSTHHEIKNILINPEDIEKLFNDNKISLSSIAVEAVLKEQIKTLGVETNDIYGITKKIQQNHNKEQDELILEKFKQKAEQGMTYGDILESYSSDNSNDFFKNVVIKYRNYFWLKNIQNELINGSNNGKNFIPIVCGAGHMQDLISQSKNMGFKGVITFEPKAYNDKMDVGFVKSYLSDQTN